MKKFLILFLKGMAMGIANVIPGVSGGTIALITEIYEDLINSLKSFNKKSFGLILSNNLSGFAQHTNLYFLFAVFGGSIASVFSIANLFKYLFMNFPVQIWAFFFGLIIASIYFVGKRIKNWNSRCLISLIFGIIVALSLSFISPANENSNLFYVFICGIIGISGMMLPGLSGSFILILMGNYELLMVEAVANIDIVLLIVFLLGSIFGLMTFSHILSWVFLHYKDATLSLLTGFIIGSLSIIWPWKKISESIIFNGKEKIIAYSWHLPQTLDRETILSLSLMLLGVVIVYSIEIASTKKKK